MPNFMFSECFSGRCSAGLHGRAEYHILPVSVHGSVPSGPVVTGDFAGGGATLLFRGPLASGTPQFGYPISPVHPGDGYMMQTVVPYSNAYLCLLEFV